MKKNLRKLHLIFKFTLIKPEWFYVVSFDGTEITLQGHYKADIYKYFEKQGYLHSVDGNKYACFTRSNIKVYLT